MAGVNFSLFYLQFIKRWYLLLQITTFVMMLPSLPRTYGFYCWESLLFLLGLAKQATIATLKSSLWAMMLKLIPNSLHSLTSPSINKSKLSVQTLDLQELAKWSGSISMPSRVQRIVAKWSLSHVWVRSNQCCNFEAWT